MNRFGQGASLLDALHFALGKSAGAKVGCYPRATVRQQVAPPQDASSHWRPLCELPKLSSSRRNRCKVASTICACCASRLIVA